MGYQFGCARNISNKGGNNIIGYSFSAKMKKMIAWESLIERDYIPYLEVDQNVKTYASQPIKFLYFLNGKQRKYTPDFYIEYYSGKRLYVEVKPESKLKNLEPEVLACVSASCEREGAEFKVVTDKIIRLQPILDNLRLLLKYALVPIPPSCLLSVSNILKCQNRMTIEQLVQMCKDTKLEVIYYLIYKGVVKADLNEKLGTQSYICLS